MKSVAAALAVIVLTGCAIGPAPAPVTAVAPAALPDAVHCGTVALPTRALTDPVPATSLDADAAAGIVGTGMLDGTLADWTIATETADLVTLVRVVDEPYDDGWTEVHDHHLVSFGTPPAIPSPNAWSLYQAIDCALRIGLDDGVNAAHVSLDPDRLPSEADTALHVFVHESACAGSRSAEGRIVVVDLVETATSVRLVLGVRPVVADVVSCVGNPATPFTVDLSAPLGDRVVLDAAVVPARELRVAGG